MQQQTRAAGPVRAPLAAGRGLLNASLFGLGLWLIAAGLLLLLPEALYAIAGLLTCLVTMVMLRSLAVRRPLPQPARTWTTRSLQR